MSRMGCYVLLKTRLVKEIREENSYKTKDYEISIIFYSSNYYYQLSHKKRTIWFNDSQLKYIEIRNGFHTWSTFCSDKDIVKHLANCRFDLINPMNNVSHGLLCAFKK